jgi:hypothetical protein
MVLNLETFVFVRLDIGWTLKFSAFAGPGRIWWGIAAVPQEGGSRL